jgi:Zn finger protein HypA/HybF involved in hydrogenase expression
MKDDYPMFGTNGFICMCGKQDIKENKFRVWCDNCHSTLVNRIKEPTLKELECRIKELEQLLNKD